MPSTEYCKSSLRARFTNWTVRVHHPGYPTACPPSSSSMSLTLWAFRQAKLRTSSQTSSLTCLRWLMGKIKGTPQQCISMYVINNRIESFLVQAPPTYWCNGAELWRHNNKKRTRPSRLLVWLDFIKSSQDCLLKPSLGLTYYIQVMVKVKTAFHSCFLSFTDSVDYDTGFH